jgi:hypothetical protein
MNQPDEYCHNCGAALGAPSAFCSNCGASLSAPEPSARAGRASSAAGTRSAQGPPEARRESVPPPHAAPPRGPTAGGPLPADSPPGGDHQAKPSMTSSRWAPLAAVGGMVVLVAAIVAVLLLVLGGSAGKHVKGTSATRAQALELLAANGTSTVSRAAPGLFAVVTTGKLTALVPAGWRATAQAAPGTARAEFADPKQADSTLTIVVQTGNRASSDRSRALSARSAAKARGFAEVAFGAIAFPGGRQAWRLAYTKTGATHETYFYSACDGGAAMVVDVSAPSGSFKQEQINLAAAAAGAEPVC